MLGFIDYESSQEYVAAGETGKSNVRWYRANFLQAGRHFVALRRRC
jgi:hypothetical protein